MMNKTIAMKKGSVKDEIILETTKNILKSI